MPAVPLVHRGGKIDEVLVNDWTAAVFSGAWANDASSESVAFWRDPFAVVHLRGGAKTGALASTIFTLPVGCRPSGAKRLPAVSSAGNVVYVIVNTDGTVVDHGRTLAAETIFMDGCTFRASQ